MTVRMKRLIALAIVGLIALAQKPAPPAGQTSEVRVAVLETKVEALTAELRIVQTKLDAISTQMQDLSTKMNLVLVVGSVLFGAMVTQMSGLLSSRSKERETARRDEEMEILRRKVEELEKLPRIPGGRGVAAGS